MSVGVVCLSGGLDSTVLAYRAASMVRDVIAVSVDYGQRHVKELMAAEQVARALGVDHVTIDLTELGALLPSALTTPHAPIPEGHYAEESMKATVVPNRNAILASLAYSIGVAHNATFVWLGSHAGDHAIYPDCRPQFFTALDTALRLGNQWDEHTLVPQLAAPFEYWPKSDIVALGAQLGAPLRMTWSCYQGGPVHCGRCGTCVERREAFQLAHIEDPTEYADDR